MHMWNADGSRGSMCGNGVRCLAKLAFDHGHVSGPALGVETDAGLREVQLLIEAGGQVSGARVHMGEIELPTGVGRAEIGGRVWTYQRACAGNNHAVIFYDGDLEAAPVLEVGAGFQALDEFPDGVNVEFIVVQDDGSLRQRTFERGSGETLACGSGATAAACVALNTGRVPGPRVRVRLTGGELVIERGAAGVFMEGPARAVFHGTVALPAS
jgi:diaminopimelate epimerase